MKASLNVEILAQPDEFTCGPTSLHAVYRYYGLDLSLDQIIHEVPKLQDGGTLAVLLGLHALRQGFRAKIYTYNLQVFDPSWFYHPKADLVQKLKAQVEAKPDHQKLHFASTGYLQYLEAGGEILFEPLSGSLIRRFLNRSCPILTGLSATYLYNTPREWGPKSEYNDVKGEPSGHFVVLSGYDKKAKKVMVADPYKANPVASGQIYMVDTNRLINSILLGILTYDANLLILEPK